VEHQEEVEVKSFKELRLTEARQMKDPKKDSMVTKGGKTIVIDKSKEKEYLKKGWSLAESTEVLEEAADFEKMSNELLKKKKLGIEFEKAAAFARVMFMNSSLSVQDKAMKGLLTLIKGIDDLTVKTTLIKILKDNGFKVKGGRVMREEVELDEGKMKEFHDYIDQGKSAQWIAKKMGLDMRTVKELMADMKESVELDEAFQQFLDKSPSNWGEDKVVAYGEKKGHKVIGVVGTGKVDGIVLFGLDAGDKKYVGKEAKVKTGQTVFRYATRNSMAGDLFPLIKIDVKRGLMYHLTQASSSGDVDYAEFESRSVKLKYLRFAATANLRDITGFDPGFGSMKESVNLDEQNTIELAKDIVKTKSAKKGLDIQTANLIVQVYNKVNDVNKKKMEKMNPKQLGHAVWKMTGKK